MLSQPEGGIFIGPTTKLGRYVVSTSGEPKKVSPLPSHDCVLTLSREPVCNRLDLLPFFWVSQLPMDIAALVQFDIPRDLRLV